jgi:hypothetical protein
MEEGTCSSTIFDLGTKCRWVISFTPRTLYPRERIAGIHCIAGWLGRRHSGVEKNILPLLWIKPRPSSPSLYRLSYPGSLNSTVELNDARRTMNIDSFNWMIHNIAHHIVCMKSMEAKIPFDILRDLHILATLRMEKWFLECRLSVCLSVWTCPSLDLIRRERKLLSSCAGHLHDDWCDRGNTQFQLHFMFLYGNQRNVGSVHNMMIVKYEKFAFHTFQHHADIEVWE